MKKLILIPLVPIILYGFLTLYEGEEHVFGELKFAGPNNATTLVEASKTKIYVSMGGTNDPFFIDSLPLAAMVWNMLRVEVLICLIGAKSDYQTTTLSPIIQLLNELNATISYLPGNYTLKKATMAQHCRIYAALSPMISENDTVILSDSDYLPFHLEQHWDDGVDLFLYNPLCCGHEKMFGETFQHLPIVTVAASKKDWLQILDGHPADYHNGSSIEENVMVYFGNETFDKKYEQATNLNELHRLPAWYSDQKLLSFRIFDWKRRSRRNFKTAEKLGTIRRIDRNNWPSEETIEKYTDNSVDTFTITKKWNEWVPNSLRQEAAPDPENATVPPRIFASMSSTADPFFLNSLPIAAMAWLRIGVHPIICLVGWPADYQTNMTKPTIDLLARIGANVTYLTGNHTLKKATLAQHCRFHAANSKLDIRPDDVIMFSDSDYLPFKLQRYWADGMDMFFYNSKCCGYDNLNGQQFPHLPVVSMAFKVSVLREILAPYNVKYEEVVSMELDIYKNFAKDIKEASYQNANGLTTLHRNRMWSSDQTLMSYRLYTWKKNQDRAIRIGEWNRVGNRLDRMKILQLDAKANISEEYVDAHIFRPFVREWKRMRDPFRNFLPKDYFALADEYGMRMVKLYESYGDPGPRDMD